MSILENLHAWCTQLLLLRKLMVIKLLKYWRQGRICWSVIGIETTGTFLAIAVEQMGESKGNCFQLYIVSVFLVKRSFSYCQSKTCLSSFLLGYEDGTSSLAACPLSLHILIGNFATVTPIIVNLYFSVIIRTGCRYTCQVKISSG